MKSAKKAIAVLLSLVMILSLLPMTVSAADPTNLITATFDISKVTKFLLHNDYTFNFDGTCRGIICDLCGNACEALYPMSAENVRVEYTQNGDMVAMRFEQTQIAGFQCVIATIGATPKAVSGSVVKGNFYHEVDDGTHVHTSQKIPFAFTLTGTALPAYTKTYSDSLEYASIANWNVTPPSTITATVGAREKFVFSLATDYWANSSWTGINGNPTYLSPSFTSGEGLLAIDVSIGAGGIWGGASCELLTFTPTDAAYNITEPTVCSGTVDCYWCGETTIPFSITINPPANPISDDPTIANNFGSAVTIEKTISPSVGYTVALCAANDYWGNMSVYTEGTAVKPYNSNDGLIDVTLTNMSGPLWGGAACIYADLQPNAGTALLTETTTTTGYFAFEGGTAFDGGTRQISFNITIPGKEVVDWTGSWDIASVFNNYVCNEGTGCVINGSTGVSYNDLASACNAIVGDSVEYLVLNKDCKSDCDVLMSPMVNLNLYGHVLDMGTHTLLNSGVIRDSEDGVGVVKLSQTTGVAFTADSGMLPIYDTAAGGYRLFSYEFKTRKNANYNTDDVRFSYTLKLTGANAASGYTLMENGGSRLATQINIGWTNDQSEPCSKDFAYTDAHIVSYGTTAKSVAAGYTPVFYIILRGVGSFGSVSATPKLASTFSDGSVNGFEAYGASVTSVNTAVNH